MIYVDNAQIPYGRMKMCHMFGDTTAELEDMARKIGLPKSAEIQNPGEAGEHIDVSMTYRDKAIKAGAVEVTSRELVKLIRRKRKAMIEVASETPALAPEPIEPELGNPEDAPPVHPEGFELPRSTSGSVKITTKAQTYNETEADEADEDDEDME